MKQILLLFLLYCGCVSAQTTTEKYNTLNNRYEYFNSNNQMIGYKQYNSLKSAWEYTDTTVATRKPLDYGTPQATYDFDRINQALAYKQNQIDSGVKSVQNAINYLDNQISNLNVDQDIKETINKRFANEYVNNISGKNYDYTNKETVTKIIDYFNSGVKKIASEELTPSNDVKELMKDKGGYHIKEVKNYTIINNQPKLENTNSNPDILMYYDGDTIYFKNGGDDWQYRNLTFSKFDTIMNSYMYFSKDCIVFIQKEFKSVILLSSDNGKMISRELVIGKYDANIHHN